MNNTLQFTELDYAIDYQANKHLDGDYEVYVYVPQPKVPDDIEYPFD